MVICLERGADLHMAQLKPLPLTVCCFSKIKISFTFLVPAYPGSRGQRAIKRAVRVCVCIHPDYYHIVSTITTDISVDIDKFVVTFTEDGRYLCSFS